MQFSQSIIQFLLGLYGFGEKGQRRRVRRGPIEIGRSSTGRFA